MGLLDDVRSQKGDNIRNNPLNDLEVKKKQLPSTSLRIDGDTHAKMLALGQIKNSTLLNLMKEMVEKEYDAFDEESKKAFDKFYMYKIDEKLDTVKRSKSK
ncbi:hypothetical protein L2Z53_11915 (plasmid) [Macrococcoides canis]|uniref:hypothetical protein n=1 Tax=Staphylococcaceae TaxID=90964 RepID=UPI001CCBC199|nr:MULTISPECIES: hypothetical protein [Macrococcus]UBH16603.1 hypothetical protein LAU44_12205 [Macrococcus armenti]UBH21237.1 hypothetical protein LAU40_12240 [Macrococcus armenti]UJS29041.1 hypothetical protein L2Z53_11915 [Macrococcus canis]